MVTKKTRCFIVLAVLYGAFLGAMQDARAQCYLGSHDDVVCPRNGANNNNATTGGEGPFVPIIDPGPAFGAYIQAPPIWIPVIFDPPFTVGLEPYPPEVQVTPPPPVNLKPTCTPSAPPPPPTPTKPTNPPPPATGKCADFMAAMRQSENSGSYTGANNYLFKGNCVGAYQFCQSTGTFQKYSGGLSSAQFQACPSCQDAAAMQFWHDNWNALKKNGACSSGYSPAALVGGSHLGGVGSARRGTGVLGVIAGTGDRSDGHTKVSQYMKKFSGYDISSCGFTCP